jgi:hypothetical protein
MRSSARSKACGRLSVEAAFGQDPKAGHECLYQAEQAYGNNPRRSFSRAIFMTPRESAAVRLGKCRSRAILRTW